MVVFDSIIKDCDDHAFARNASIPDGYHIHVKIHLRPFVVLSIETLTVLMEEGLGVPGIPGLWLFPETTSGISGTELLFPEVNGNQGIAFSIRKLEMRCFASL